MFADTDDQQLFESATAGFLAARYPPERVRSLAAEDATFEPALWREGARLGWTALLVPEGHGGGSITGNGLADLLIVACQFGRHAAPGPLFGTNLVAAALGAWGSADQRDGPLQELVAGDAVAAWAHASASACASAVTATGSGDTAVIATGSGDTVVLAGRVGTVEAAADARYVLVTAHEVAGPTHYLVPTATAGVELAPLRSVDLTRRFQDVTLHDVAVPAAARVGEPGAAADHDAHLLDVAAVLALGEMAGALDRALAMTLEWTANRYSFGRPLNSYQEIKHRLADARTQLEASEAVAARAAHAVGTGAPNGRDWASAGMAYVGERGPEVVQDCIQLHGGIGVTYDHDLHLFLRRVALDARLFGAPRAFAARLGARAAAAEGAYA